MRYRHLILVAASLTSFSHATAQSEDAARFEVASVKLSPPDTRIMMIRNMPGGRFMMSGVTLRDMVMNAWNVQSYQIIGGPSWCDSLKFDVTAKAESRPRPEQLRQLYQALLQERFQLAAHSETRDMPIYTLVLARKDAKLGLGLTQKSDAGCQPPDPTKPAAKTDVKSPGCGGMRTGARQIIADTTPITSLAPTLSRILGKPVVDRTGLAGYFDIKMEWSPDDNQALPASSETHAPEAVSGGPSIFTALREQLGLRLENGRGPVEMIVIERVEKPSEN